MLRKILRLGRAEESYEQAVIVRYTFPSGEPLGTPDEVEAVFVLQREFERAVAGEEGAVVDGHDLTDEGCIIYVYGRSADALWRRLESPVKTRVPWEGSVTLQYGRAEDPDARESVLPITRQG